MSSSRTGIIPDTGHYFNQNLVLLGLLGLNPGKYFMCLTLDSGKINCFWENEHALTHFSVDQGLGLCRSEAVNHHLCHAEQGELFCFCLPKRGLCRCSCYLCQSKKGHARHQHFNSTRVKPTPHTTQRTNLLIISFMLILFIILQQQQRLGALWQFSMHCSIFFLADFTLTSSN